ncbi:hypothetical protein FACS1894217_08910 [Clostridia bacterium]|nr:hypothetical protein FACS1894217_08910 [Clostridia bacterium]
MNYELKSMRLAELMPHPQNPRIHPEDMLKKLCCSIQEFGFTNPVLVSEDNIILAGHARCTAAERFGMTEVPCIVLPLKGLSADAYVIADNKLNELSVWDETKLAELFRGFDIGDFDAELTGFSIDEIDALFAPKGCVDDEFDEEKAKKEVEDKGGAVTQINDIWVLGDHRLICGDSTLPETFEKLLEDKKAQLCVTSPSCGEKPDIGKWLSDMREAIKNISRHTDLVCWNLADLPIPGTQFIEPTNAHSVQMFAEYGFRPLWIRVLKKKAVTGNASKQYEYVSAFGNGGEDYDGSEYEWLSAFAAHNYRFTQRLAKDERRNWGMAAVWDLGGAKGAMVELPWRCIKMHSDKGDIVLEPFSGTFTTGIACEQTGRKCYAIERVPAYCDIAVKRYREFVPDAEICLFRNGAIISLDETGVLS